MPTDDQGNPLEPVASGREPEANRKALNDLTQAVKKLTDMLTHQASPSSPEGIAGGKAASANPFIGSGGFAPSLEKERLQRKLAEDQPAAGEISQHASVGEIGTIELLKEMRRREKDPITGARTGKRQGLSYLDKADPKLPFTGAGELSESASRPGIPSTKTEAQTGQRAGGVSPNASGPPSGIISGMSLEGVSQAARESIKIPWYGDWRLDDKLAALRDFTTQTAIKHGTWDEEKEEWNWKPGQGGRWGETNAKVAAAANWGHAHAYQMEWAKKLYKTVHGIGQEGSAAGMALGYSPQTGFGPSHVLGIANPFASFTSEAGKQGLGMNVDALVASKLGTGISTQEAAKVYGSLAGEGFSNQKSGFLGLTTGGDLQNIAEGFGIPMAKAGVPGELSARFTDQLKTGTVGIRELNDALKGLTGASKESHQTVAQMTESLLTYTQAAEQNGGTQVGSTRAGIEYTNITGKNPMVAAAQLNNPFFQGQAMSKYGVLPWNIGGLPGSAIAETELSSVQMLRKGFSSMQPVIGPNGEEIESKLQVEAGAISHVSGIPTASVEQTLKNEGKVLNQLKAERYNKQYGGQRKAMEKEQQNKHYTKVYHEKRSDVERQFANKGKNTVNNNGEHLEEVIDKLNSEFNSEEGAFSRKGWDDALPAAQRGILKRGEKQLLEDLKAAGASGTERKKVEKASNRDKEHVAEEILQKHGSPTIKENATNVNGVTIGLSAQAEKLLKIEQGGNSSAGRGGPPSNSHSTGPLDTAVEVGEKILHIF